MAINPAQSALLRNKPGSLFRKQMEQRAMTDALPEGKGGVGTASRNLIEEPLERPVAPGAKKVVGVKPSMEEGNIGMLPGDVQAMSEPGMEGMGMFSAASAGGASKASSGGRSSGKGSSSPAPIKSSGNGNNVSVKAPALRSSVSNKPTTSNRVSSNYVAGPSDEVKPGQKLSEQQQRAASGPLNVKESLSMLAQKKDPINAVKGLIERAKKTILNTKYNDKKGYQNLLRSLTQPKKTGVSRTAA